MKKVIYTIITGKYDNLNKIKHKSDGWDYICFTDNLNIPHNGWKLVKIKNPNNLDDYRIARKYKLLPHLYLKDYDYSIHIDGNTEILCDLNQLESDIILSGFDINMAKHRLRDCLYEEAQVCIKGNKGNYNDIVKQIKDYKKEEMPTNFGLYSCGFQFRNLKSERLQSFSHEWFNEIIKYSVRDQISFPYVLWKGNEININLLDWKLIYSKYFKRKRHTK